jgi:hypothetical protein
VATDQDTADEHMLEHGVYVAIREEQKKDG